MRRRSSGSSCCWRPGRCLRGNRGFLRPCVLLRRVVRRRRAECGRVGERSGDGRSIAGLPGFPDADGAGDPPDDDQRGQGAEHGQDLVPPRPQRTRRPPVMPGTWVRVLTIRLLRKPELGFLPCSGQRLGLLAPLCAVPPAQDLRAGPVKIPSRVGIPSGRLPCGGMVLTGWRRLIAHGFLSPLRGGGAALSRSKDASKAVAVHGGYEADMSLLPGCVRLA
jgi:hypothetical protein